MTLNQKPFNCLPRAGTINKVAIFFPLLVCLSGNAHADTYVVGPKYYLVGSPDGYVKTGAEVVSKRVKQLCGAGVKNCSGTFVREYYSDSAASWWWEGIWTYQIINENPPNAPVISTYQQTIGGFMNYECPSGFTKYADKTMPGVCVAPDRPLTSPQDLDSDSCNCKASTPDAGGATNPEIGNPIEIGTAVKRQIETDYSDPSGSLSFNRIYRSDTNRWEFSYQMAAGNIQQSVSGMASRGAGCFNGLGGISGAYCYPYIAISADKGFFVRRSGGVPLYFNTANSFLPAVDINDRVSPWMDAGAQVGWTVVNGSSDAVEKYNLEGQLVETKSRNGRVKTFVYSDVSTPTLIAPDRGYLLSVTDAFGRTLNFTYDDRGLLHTMTDPNGQVYIYTFGSARTLSSVTYPDGKVKSYLYNETAYINYGVSLPFALTGIVDENGIRYATFRYNLDGTAISTEHALGVNKYAISYASSSSYNTVTDPLGTVRTYSILKPVTFRKARQITQPSADGATTVSTTLTYDANGNLATVTDFNGNVTKYTYDLSRNLPLTKISAFGTTSATTTTTVWEPRWRLPTKIAEPKRITSYTYDDNANVLSKVVQPTTDANGTAGVNATSSGPARTWIYTYNALGQVLTSKGPRTDVDDTTIFTYDGQGNLTTKTNPLGQVTTYSNYDASGRVGTEVDPNGLVTSYSYTPRGWLASRTVGNETTNYDYDGVGQLTKVTLPNGSQIIYTYDGAHRLTNVSDSLGNSIVYTLDAIGNRTAETVNDVNGVLTRKTTMVYDTLNNLKTQTGGVQ